MTAVFESLLPVFLTIILGLALRRGGHIEEPLWTGIEKLAYWVLFPALLAKTLITADLANVPVTGLTLALLASIVTMTVVLVALKPVIAPVFDIDGPAYSSLFQCSIRWNAFIALAIVGKLYGIEAIAVIAVAIAAMVPLLNLIAVLAVAGYASPERLDPTYVAKQVLSNPFIWASLIGLAINLSGVVIYNPLLTTLDLMGRSALGIGLLLVGSGLRVRAALQPTASVWAASALRLLGMPLIVTGWCFVFDVDGLAFKVALIAAAVPTAMNAFVLARQMGGDAPLVAAMVTVQTVLSFLTIPLVLWLASLSLFG